MLPGVPLGLMEVIMRPLTPEQLEIAKALRPGNRQRADHDCGSGKTALISTDDKGYRLHCFRCGEGGWSPKAPEPLSVRLERLRAGSVADGAVSSFAALPEPRVSRYGDWPPEARLWLLKAGLSAHDVGRLGAYYHPTTMRVVLPVLDPFTGLLKYWQARSLYGRMPKYLGSPVGRSDCVPRWGSAEAITLTEDILSAYKVGTVAEGWCLLGTSINHTCLSMLLAEQRPVNVWLDPDPPGRRAAAKVTSVLKGYGLVVRNVLLEKDPKLLHRSQIKELLCSK